MTTHFNQIIDKHLSFTDFSLISEISDISFEEKTSPISLTNKQVRFNTVINNNPFLNSSVISDASLLESESQFYKITTNSNLESNNRNNNNSIRTRPYEKSKNDSNGDICPTILPSNIKNNERYNFGEIIDKSNDIGNDHNDDTSVWSSGTETSVQSIADNFCNIKESLFKTIDEMKSGSSNDSSVVETIISDNLSDPNSDKSQNQTETITNLSKPIINSSRRLKDEIQSLEMDLHYRQTYLTQDVKELAARKLAEQLNFKEKFNNDNSYAFVSQTPIELTQPLNVKRNEELFPDLTRLSVHDETIFIAQNKKLAAIRNRAGVDKIKRKIEDGLPEPDIMEFFDASKHVFKSVNLSMGQQSQINLKPALSLGGGRQYSIFRDRELLHQFQ